MHPPNHGIKHQLLMHPELPVEHNANQCFGYPTFDTVNIVFFNAYKGSNYSPLTLIYDNGWNSLTTAVIIKTDKFKLIY